MFHFFVGWNFNTVELICIVSLLVHVQRLLQWTFIFSFVFDFFFSFVTCKKVLLATNIHFIFYFVYFFILMVVSYTRDASYLCRYKFNEHLFFLMFVNYTRCHATKSTTRYTCAYPPCSQWRRIPRTRHQLSMWRFCRESLGERHYLRILWKDILLFVWKNVGFEFALPFPLTEGRGRRWIIFKTPVLYILTCVCVCRLCVP